MPCCESKEIRSVRVTWAKSNGSGQDSKEVELKPANNERRKAEDVSPR